MNNNPFLAGSNSNGLESSNNFASNNQFSSLLNKSSHQGIINLSQPSNSVINPFNKFNYSNPINSNNIKNAIGDINNKTDNNANQISTSININRSWGYNPLNHSNTMHHCNSEKLNDTHPLSWKYIETIQNNFSALDKNDLCFPIFYRQVKIYCEETNVQVFCNSITALPKYVHLSFEELRNYNYKKINNRPNNINQMNFKLIKKQKYFSIDFLLKSKIFNDFTYEEKRELEKYFRNFNIDSDDSFDSLQSNFTHNNFNFYNYIKSTNNKNIQNYKILDNNINNTNPFSTINNNFNKGNSISSNNQNTINQFFNSSNSRNKSDPFNEGINNNMKHENNTQVQNPSNFIGINLMSEGNCVSNNMIGNNRNNQLQNQCLNENFNKNIQCSNDPFSINNISSLNGNHMNFCNLNQINNNSSLPNSNISLNNFNQKTNPFGQNNMNNPSIIPNNINSINFSNSVFNPNNQFVNSSINNSYYNPFSINNNVINNLINTQATDNYSLQYYNNRHSNILVTDLIDQIKYKNYPIDPKDFYLKINTNNNNIGYNILNIDYYKNKIEKDYDGNRKEFLKSILQKANINKGLAESDLDNNRQFNVNHFVNDNYNNISDSYLHHLKYQTQKRSYGDYLFMKEHKKLKIKKELQEKIKIDNSSYLLNKSKKTNFIKDYYNKIRNKMISNIDDDRLFKENNGNNYTNSGFIKNYKTKFDNLINNFSNNCFDEQTNLKKNQLDFNNESKTLIKTRSPDFNFTDNINNYDYKDVSDINKIINLLTEDIDEENELISLYKYIKNDFILDSFMNNKNPSLIKIKIAEFNKFEQQVFFKIINFDFDFNLLCELIITHIKGFSMFKYIPDNFFKNYINKFLFMDQLLSSKSFDKVFNKTFVRNLIDDKLGEITFKYFEFIFSLDYDKIVSEFLIYNKLQKEEDNRKDSRDKLETIDGNPLEDYYPYFKLNKKYLICNPSILELRRLTKNQLKCIEDFSIENINGKICFEENIDLTEVNLDCIKLDYLDFEILNIDDISYNKLNKDCKVFLNVYERFENDEQFFIFCKNLDKKYNKKKVIIEDYDRENDSLILNYKPN